MTTPRHRPLKKRKPPARRISAGGSRLGLVFGGILAGILLATPVANLGGFDMGIVDPRVPGAMIGLAVAAGYGLLAEAARMVRTWVAARRKRRR